MLGNLLDNACKWAASRVELSAREEGSQLCICIDDDGPGLPAGVREKVFERGVRMDEQVPGTGLGLAIVRDLARLYEGEVVLETAPMGGTRALLRLPRAT
jgi:signal transduction histidine kinase